jgi:ubiquinone/menaquinone biosynthesis C-methylase UbiE
MTDPVAGTRETYDAIAAEFDRLTREPWAELAADVEAFVTRLPTGALVADVGCGPGRDAALLRARGVEVIRLDVSLAMLRIGERSRAVQADMRALPLRSRSLEGLWCQAALLHVPLADVPAVLAEFARVAKAGGPLHLTVAEGDGEGWQSDMYGGKPRWFAHHRRDSLMSALADAGFTTTRVRHRLIHRHWLAIQARRN